MADTWFISDTHFFHENILRLCRPQFCSIAQMHECIVDNWNSRVKHGDRVIHLGDVAFKTSERADELAKLMSSLNGTKHLLMGNHDDAKRLHPFFKTIGLWKVFKEHNFFCSHVPMLREQFRGVRYQVHGHTHKNIVYHMAYINVCVEVTNYAPVGIDWVLRHIRARAWL